MSVSSSSPDQEDPKFSRLPGNFQHYDHPLPLNYWTYTPSYKPMWVQSFVSCLHGIALVQLFQSPLCPGWKSYFLHLGERGCLNVLVLVAMAVFLLGNLLVRIEFSLWCKMGKSARVVSVRARAGGALAPVDDWASDNNWRAESNDIARRHRL